MVDVKTYFQDAESWEGGYEGKGGRGLLTKIANKFFRKKSLNARLKSALDLAQPLSGKTVLDVGCGTGIVSRHFLKAGAESVLGIDYNPNMVNFAKNAVLEKFDQNKIKFEVQDLNLYTIQADIVLLLGVVPYYENLGDVLGNVIRNNPETIIFQYLPKTKTLMSCSVAGILLHFWAKIRKLEYYKHPTDAVDLFMTSGGYKLKQTHKVSFVIVCRYDKT